MKRILQSLLGIVAVLGLALAAFGVAQNAQNSSPINRTTEISGQLQPVEWATATTIPHSMSSRQENSSVDVKNTSDITTTVEKATPTPELLDYKTIKVANVEEITTPVGMEAPDKQKTLITKGISYKHILSSNNGNAFFGSSFTFK